MTSKIQHLGSLTTEDSRTGSTTCHDFFIEPNNHMVAFLQQTSGPLRTTLYNRLTALHADHMAGYLEQSANVLDSADNGFPVQSSDYGSDIEDIGQQKVTNAEGSIEYRFRVNGTTGDITMGQEITSPMFVSTNMDLTRQQARQMARFLRQGMDQLVLSEADNAAKATETQKTND